MQFKFDLFNLGMLTIHEEFVSRIVFLFSAKSKMADKSHVTLKRLTASAIMATLDFGVILTSHFLDG